MSWKNSLCIMKVIYQIHGESVYVNDFHFALWVIYGAYNEK